MRTNAQCSPTQSGFTLVEAAVVVAVLTVLVSVAAPSMGNLMLDSRVKQASLDLYSAMTYARSEAIARDANVSVSAAGTWSSGWKVTVGTATLKQTGPLSNITVTGPADNTLTYKPNGRLAVSSPVTFTFSAPGNGGVTMRCVSSTLSGRPVLQVDRNRDGDCTNG